jgi:2-iminobutanoate/2-iminopropanoate deaminase
MPKIIIGGPTKNSDGTMLALSKVVRAGDFIFVSGQVPFDSSGKVVGGGIKPQTKQVIENIRTLLQSAGASLDDIVKTTVWLVDQRDFNDFNVVYASFFSNGPPARVTVVTDLVIDAAIEIDAIAYRP